MATVASFNVALIASSGRFIGAISQADRRWMQFARNIQRETRRMPEHMRQVTNASLTMARTVAKAFAVAGAVASGAGVWGVRLAAQYEQTQIAFATMLGSMEEADSFLRFLERRARTTPFGFVQLQDFARSMLAWGFARQEIEQMIDPIGDFVAAMGGGQEHMDRIVRALGQIRARGKLVSQEMLQLTEVGVPAWELLARHLGVTIPRAMEMTTKGMVDAQTAIAAIIQGLATDPRFAGAMEAQARTLLGQWEQVKDALTTIVRGIGRDIIAITKLSGRMQRLNDAIGQFADSVSQRGFIGALREMFPPWLQAVVVGLAGAIGGALVPVLVRALIPALRRLSVSLIATLRPLLPWILIGTAVAVTAWLIARNWQRAWSYTSSAVLSAASWIVGAIASIVQAMSALFPPLQGLAERLRGWSQSLRASAANARAAAQTAVTTAQLAENAERVTQTAQQAAEAQEGLGEAVEGAGKSAQKNLQSFDEVHTIQKEMAAPEMPVAEMALGDLGIGGMLAGVEAAFNGVFEAAEQVGGKLVSFWESTRDRIRSAWDSLKKWALDTFPWIANIAEAAGRAGEWLASAWDATKDFLIRTWDAIKRAGSQAWAWLSQELMPLWEAVKAAASSIWGAIKETLIWLWGIIRDAALEIWNGLVLTISAVWEAIKIAARIAWIIIEAILRGAWNSIVTIATTIWTGLVLFWEHWGQSVLAILSGAWEQIKITVETAINLVKDIIGLVLAIIRGDWEEAWERIKGIGQTIWDFIVRTWENLEQTAAQVWANIVNNVTNWWNTLKGRAESLWAAVKTGFADAWDAIKSTTSNIWRGIVNGIIGFINRIIDAINGMIHELNKISFSVPEWVPIIGGREWGFNIRTIRNIPYLATGGTVTGSGLAVVGEAGPELLSLPRGASVTPLSGGGTVEDAVYRAVYSAIRDAARVERLQGGPSQDTQVVLEIDGQRIARALIPPLAREQQRTGFRLIPREA